MPRAQANGIEIEYDVVGKPTDPTMLLIMGLAAQMVWWEDTWCEDLASRGFQVVRFDNRDVGLSTQRDDGALPDLNALMAGDPASAPYLLEDMAEDAAGLLDALGVDQAHVVGASMGGMIAQALAITHPEKVLSLCSIMSTTGARDVGQPSPEAVPVVLRPPATDWDGYLAGALASAAVIGSPAYPPDPEHLRARAERCWQRGYHPQGIARQLAAILASPDRTPALARLKVPTLVVHGEADPLVAPSGGEATAKAIPGARLMLVPGMGHDLPPVLWDQIIDAIVDNARRADQAQAERGD
jgi:pimeloyl-ACP methyl ester carboxylesterase